MMVVTHTVMSVAFTSLAMGSAEPMPLLLAAIASQLPDVDTSKSVPGRLLFPISRYLETRFSHRSITHSFLATGLFGLVASPLMYVNVHLWQALVLGYFLGWFGDVFTKSGVTAFYPSSARLVIPGNPRLRLSTNSPAELFVLGVLVLVAVVSIAINSGGGIIRGFNQVLGMPSGAVEIVNNEGHQYLLNARINGIWRLTSSPVNSEQPFEVVKSLNPTDILIKDQQGNLYSAGVSEGSQIQASQVKIERVKSAQPTHQQFYLDQQPLEDALQGLPIQRTYVSGNLVMEDGESIQLLNSPQQFASIQLQGESLILESANPQQLTQLGDPVVTGSLIVRTIHVQQ